EEGARGRPQCRGDTGGGRPGGGRCPPGDHGGAGSRSGWRRDARPPAEGGVMTAAPAMLTVFDGRELCGFILKRGRTGYEAFDRGERPLGIFKRAPAAANAVVDPA